MHISFPRLSTQTHLKLALMSLLSTVAGRNRTVPGKTELLYHMILHRILPASHTFTPYSPNTLRRFSTPVSFSGLKQTCLVYSLTSGGFSLVRLAELVRAQLFMAYTKAAEETWPNARGRTE